MKVEGGAFGIRYHVKSMGENGATAHIVFLYFNNQEYNLIISD